MLGQFNEISNYMKIIYDEYYNIQPREIYVFVWETCFGFEIHVLALRDTCFGF